MASERHAGSGQNSDAALAPDAGGVPDPRNAISGSPAGNLDAPTNTGKEAPATPDAGAVRAQLARILSSSTFSKADRLSRFLSLAVEKALAGEDLKEYELGVEVCGRKSDFDPRVDSIVRVEAGRLRAKLREYYELHGTDDAVRVQLPKGTYIPTFEAVPAMSSSSQSDRDEDGAAIARHGIPARLRWLAAAGLLALAIAVGAIWKLKTRPAAPGPTAIASVAVLPFMNLGANDSCQRFTDGLTEEVTAELARTNLRVPARTTAFQFKDKAVDVQDVGRKLNVDAVLEGSVRQEGDRFRVTVQLISVADGYHLWAETYERSTNDPLLVQREISLVAVESLKRRATGQDRWRGHGQATTNPEALADYLEAYRVYSPKRLREASPEVQQAETQRAIGLFKRAIEKDPGFALAWAGLADVSDFAIGEAEKDAPAMEAQARAAAERALELDDTIALGHEIRGALRFYRDWDFAGAEASLRRAVELDPRKPYAQIALADVLRLTGRWQEASVEVARAVMLEPHSAELRVQSALLLHSQRQTVKALEEGRRATELEPNNPRGYWVSGLCYEQLGKWEAAEKAYRRVLELSPNDSLGVPAMGYLMGKTGRPSDARRILDELLTEERQGAPRAYSIALVYAGLGLSGQAFDWLEQAFTRRDPSLRFLKVDLRFEPLQSHPRYAALLRRMGLADYAEAARETAPRAGSARL